MTSHGELTRIQSDLKGMTKISSSIIILRKAPASAWTKDLDDKMNQWLTQYINWLETNSLAIEEKESTKFVFPPTSPLICIDLVPC